MQRTMGIDYGEKRVGVAVSDDSGSFAFPKTILDNTDSLLEDVQKIADAESVDTIVIGESDNPAGGENTITRRITIFGEALKIRTGLDVQFVSEAYSTKEARRAYEGEIRKRKTKKSNVDDSAAAIILQSYLDSRSNKDAAA